MSSNLSSLTGFADFVLLLLGQLDLERINILLEPTQVGGARNWNDVVSLSHQPCEGQLRRRGILLLGDRGDLIDECEVLGEVLRCTVSICSLEGSGRVRRPPR